MALRRLIRRLDYHVRVTDHVPSYVYLTTVPESSSSGSLVRPTRPAPQSSRSKRRGSVNLSAIEEGKDVDSVGHVDPKLRRVAYVIWLVGMCDW